MKITEAPFPGVTVKPLSLLVIFLYAQSVVYIANVVKYIHNVLCFGRLFLASLPRYILLMSLTFVQRVKKKKVLPREIL